MKIIERLPDNVRVYIEHGGEDMADGYVRFLQEEQIDQIADIMKKYDLQYDGVPFAVTVFADVLSWEDGFVILHRLSEGDEKVMLSGTTFLFQNLEDEGYQKDFFDIDLYREAISKCGNPKSEECFVLEPLPQLGGAREIDYVNIGDMRVYLELIVTLR